MTLTPLPAFVDNYIWLLHDGQRALVVDPGESAPVFDALARDGLQLEAILVTHHHSDHVGGIDALRNATGARVYGPAGETMPEPCERLRGGQRLRVLDQGFEVFDVPGHTAGHIAFYGPQIALTPSPGPLLFCGDTLFSGGCGRLFEGTPAQMLASLTQLAHLPGHTRVCCTHEYTLSNLRFARAVEPDNTALQTYQQTCEALRAQGRPTLPSTLALEQQINPFLRTREPAVIAAARAFDPQVQDELGTFTAVRQWKNQFK